MSRARALRLPASLLTLLLVGVGLTACGNDDAGGGAMSDEQFCARIAELEESGEDMSDDEAMAELGRLAAQAPNEELRQALAHLAEVTQQMSEFDEDDPDAMGAAMELMFDPQFMASAETVESYMSDTCGIETDTGFDEDMDFGEDMDLGEDMDVDEPQTDE